MNAVLPRTIETQRRYIIEQAQKRLGKTPINCECEELVDMPLLEDFEEIEEMIDIVVKDSIESLTTNKKTIKKNYNRSDFIDSSGKKRCYKCGIEANNQEDIDKLFGIRKRNPDGRQIYCRNCRSIDEKHKYSTDESFRKKNLDRQREKYKDPKVKLKGTIRRIRNYENKKNKKWTVRSSILAIVAKTIIHVIPLYEMYPKIYINPMYTIPIKYGEKK